MVAAHARAVGKTPQGAAASENTYPDFPVSFGLWRVHPNDEFHAKRVPCMAVTTNSGPSLIITNHVRRNERRDQSTIIAYSFDSPLPEHELEVNCPTPQPRQELPRPAFIPSLASKP